MWPPWCLGASYGPASVMRVTCMWPLLALAGLDAVLAARVHDRDEADDAAVALDPAPREGGEGDAFAGDLVDVAADVLEADDAVAEQGAVARLPVGEVVGDRAAGVLLVLLDHAWDERSVRLHADGGAERVVERLAVDAEALYLLCREPLAGFLVGAGRLDEVFAVVAVVAVPAGVDDDDVALFDGRPRALEVVGADHLPLLLRDRDDDPRSEVLRERDLVHELGALDDVRRGVGVRRAVHERRDLLRQHARLGVIVEALDLDVGEVRPERRVVAPRMRQVEELQAVGTGLRHWMHSPRLSPAVPPKETDSPYGETVLSEQPGRAEESA